ncbi:LytTR family transcriptional regulator DNA-binding domain-containing protein [Massilia sp. G4R7]|uniref:LytTR family transcriptional regulator DNA-binding domain-containing protein n=1 Tax=Massilia phyllostachyos TaxID=2898585 RepID=A0ABS8Q3J5_9BURK|nr:LytTR family transcriptional regulator DNA-binding domain-containing protein [Massilia phyllostachyos]MCD2516319.1 LytTR family transcriptional regulator DNA-binding domain-containing protein [Massilia phyllostachyos]
MRVLIVDDEHLARALLREYLAGEPEVEIVGECANGFEAVKAIGELDPDLVFLDIQMPKLDGFEVVELAGAKPHYVFATAYDQFALRAFEVHAIDYLLKPFGRERLAQALAHARSRLAPAHVPAQAQALEAVVREAARRQGHLERILIKDGARVHVVAAETVDYIEAQDDYVQVHAGGKSWLKHGRLSELETQLDPQVFIRIHRSYLVNAGSIARIEPSSKDNYCAVLKDGARLPISRSGYARVRELMR